MKKIIIFMTFALSSFTFASSISGTIEAKGNIPKGTLYIFAKKYDGSMPMPLAVRKINNPTFPLKFSLSKKDQMMEGMPFNGPFKITARISPSGGAMDKSGIEATSTKKVNLGDSDIKILLK